MKTFEQHIIEYIPNLRRYASALSFNCMLPADDLVQDTLERALLKQSLWDVKTKLRPWLFTIMHNLFINQLNKNQLRLVEDIEMQNKQQHSSEDPEHDYFATQLKAQLQYLPLRQKEVLLLVSFEGFSYQEVATILDIPVGTIMSRLSRGREKLRQVLFDNKPIVILNKNNISPIKQVKRENHG
ncbi:MAG: RNA polymerase sigma factor [Pseudomonadota bacterium]